MSLAIVYSRAQSGMKAPLVTVEVHLSNGLPSLSIVGLPETAVKESKDRVRSAIINSQFDFPTRRITINLAPADLPKEGGRFDLPIAIGILAASGQIPEDMLAKYEFTGELALSGELRPIKGALPLALTTKKNTRALILPTANANEAGLISGLNIHPADNLLNVCAHLAGQIFIPLHKNNACSESETVCILDISDVKGQHQAKRALQIAASGGHNIIFSGPPGSGKTMLASRLSSILPPLNEEEAIESATIASIRGVQNIDTQFKKRPFRAPHHTSSSVALVGGGSHPKPGEISLAHHGILFLDELPEFSRHVLESLREPLESGTVTISRAAQYAEYPAKFQLIAAMNPCPCGYLGSTRRECQCSELQINRYKQKLSGPLLDRIDMHVEVPDIPKGTLSKTQTHETPSTIIKQKIIKAQQLQLERQGKLNNALLGKEIDQYCPLTPTSAALLEDALEKLKLSARAYHRILKVARTIADFEQDKDIQTKHITEAISYRRLDRQ